jgi:hypothetical protein
MVCTLGKEGSDLALPLLALQLQGANRTHKVPFFLNRIGGGQALQLYRLSNHGLSCQHSLREALTAEQS